MTAMEWTNETGERTDWTEPCAPSFFHRLASYGSLCSLHFTSTAFTSTLLREVSKRTNVSARTEQESEDNREWWKWSGEQMDMRLMVRSRCLPFYSTVSLPFNWVHQWIKMVHLRSLNVVREKIEWNERSERNNRWNEESLSLTLSLVAFS